MEVKNIKIAQSLLWEYIAQGGESDEFSEYNIDNDIWQELQNLTMTSRWWYIKQPNSWFKGVYIQLKICSDKRGCDVESEPWYMKKITNGK